MRNARSRQAITPALAVTGVAVASYLTVVHYEHDALVCGLGDCATVQTSSYATLAGVPVALLGILMYVAILALSIFRASAPERSEVLTLALFAISLTGLLYAGYLTYVEIWVIDAICQWCVASAIVTLAIFVVEARTLWAAEPQDGT